MMKWQILLGMFLMVSYLPRAQSQSAWLDQTIPVAVINLTQSDLNLLMDDELLLQNIPAETNYDIIIKENLDSEMLGDLELSEGGKAVSYLTENDNYFKLRSYREMIGDISDQAMIFECDPELFAFAKNSDDLSDLKLECSCIAELTKNQLSSSFLEVLPVDALSFRIIKLVTQEIELGETLLLEYFGTPPLQEIKLSSMSSHVFQIFRDNEWSDFELDGIIDLTTLDQTVEESQYYQRGLALPRMIKSRLEHSDQWTVRMVDKNAKSTVRNTKSKSNSPLIVAQPNPTFGEIYFQFESCPNGEYTVEVYNVIGKVLYTKSVYIDKNQSVPFDFGFLSKGTYLYSVINEKGEKVQTRRLIIMNI